VKVSGQHQAGALPCIRLVTKNSLHKLFKTDRFRSRSGVRVLILYALLAISATSVLPQSRSRILHNPTSGDPVPKILLLQILRAEDERRWDGDLRNLFSARNAGVRERAALAAGRIGNEDAVADLIRLLQHDDESSVRAMAAFALGEIESPLGADALVAALKDSADLRPRAVEALGKITAALPKEQEARARGLSGAILSVLNFEARRRSAQDESTILFALTAVLRAKPENAGPIVAEFLHYSDPRIRADAANTLARLKLKDGNDQLRNLLVSDPDPVVRANAARVLGATEDKASFEPLLNRALKDKDSRVRVSAIRALGSLKDAPATLALLERGAMLLSATRRLKDQAKSPAHPVEANELLEIATALGRLRQDSKDERTMTWLRKLRPVIGPAPEIEIALARIHPSNYLSEIMKPALESILVDWRAASSIAQGLGEIAAADSMRGNSLITRILLEMLDYRNSRLRRNTLVAVHSEYAIPDVLRAYAAFKPKDLDGVLRKHLKESDVVVRGTAADLLSELPPDESNARALITALPVALADKELNDAALSILDSLAKQKSDKANEAIKTALNSSDYLIRRKAVAVLKANGAGDFTSRIGTVQTRNTTADYERAIARMGKQIDAVVTTDKGSFTIRLLPDEATLNVDNFIQLAKRNYFNGITIHRVVPNFVIQDGDPRGDGNGGPGYQIRCEINEVPYTRGAVGVALSGKDTGGSQWFVTHAPQPHLDGGYTVFGNVIAGMDTVDNIVRGDVIRSIVITETDRRSSGRRRLKNARKVNQ
jgi:cyclophilin family peptidyl-prolyl cis-trans isomerase/HEAT repeat protein